MQTIIYTIKKIRIRNYQMDSYAITRNFSAAMILTVFLLISGHAYPQYDLISLPMLTAPSPKASMMNSFGNYPVNLYTGLVDITVPIFEININGIKVPVEFKYHASGLRYDDDPMELGYGWTLIAGGTISHSVRGTPEGRSISGSGQRSNPYFWAKDISQIQRFLQTGSGSEPDNDQNKLININNGVKYPLNDASSYYSDSEYDRWDYNFLNHTGQSYRCEGYVINVPTSGFDASSLYDLINIVDNDGISYTFKQMERDNWGYNEVWYLTKIVSANKADEVTFNYTTFTMPSVNNVKRRVIDTQFEVQEYFPTASYISTDMKRTGGPGFSYKAFYPPLLNSISYRGGKIEFTYVNPTLSRNLSEIRIYDNRNILVKIVKLQKPRTDWLDGIEFRDNANAVQQTYAFEYNGTFPTGDFGIDYWGYYNGAVVNQSAGYIPNFTIQCLNPTGSFYPYTILGTDRTPNPDKMQYGILTKIIYPTKGYTVFEYEAHKANDHVYGGLRIKEQRSYNSDNTLLLRKRYKYGTGESGNGRAVVPIYDNQLIAMKNFCTESLILEASQGQGTNALGGKTRIRCFYPFMLTDYYSSGSTVVYPEVTEYSDSNSVTNGKTVYKYTDTPDESALTFRGACQPQKFKSYQWRNGLLKSKEISNSSNQTVYSLTNYYSYLFESETLNLGVTRYADIVEKGNISGYSAEFIRNNLHSLLEFSSEIDGTLFDYYNYYITTGMPALGSSVEYKDGVTTTTVYSDYKSFGLPSQMQVTNSDGNNMITKYKYPDDFNTVAPYSSMSYLFGSHILTPIIQEEQYKGTSFLSKTVNEYKNWGNNMFDLEIVKIQATTNSPLENRITYHNRDSYGNPQYISKDNADNVVYLWGYNGQYPIAEIKNATFAEAEAAAKTVFSVASANALSTSQTPNETKLQDGSLQRALPNAQVTTYTYKPLVGVLTMTNPREVVTKYDYDAFGRLIRVTQAGRVIEEYNYHYKN